MQKNLISIITPCYNSSKYIHRLLDSILSQDFPRVEMFIVDDGSTDNSKDIIMSYVPKFEKRGYVLNYVYQENAGQAIAVNHVLSKINGEFLTWPDSDDYYNNSDSLSSFVEQFKKLDDTYGLIRCYPLQIDEDSLLPVNSKIFKSYDVEQFENYLYSKRGVVWPPISYMAKVSCFKRVNPTMSIYTSFHCPQNWQMLLPLLFSYKCHTIHSTPSCVLVRTSSYSRGTYKTYNQLITYYTNFENILYNTLDRISEMNDKQKDNYKKEIRKKYLLIKYQLSIENHQYEGIKKHYKLLQKEGIRLSLKERIRYHLLQYPTIYKITVKLKNII